MTREQIAKMEDEISSDEGREILRRALERPGVKEMMTVYQQWEHLRKAVQPYRQTAVNRHVVATADTTEPMHLRIV